MISFQVEVPKLGGPAFQVLMARLQDRSGLFGFVADEAEATTQDYLREISTYRHATANRLGAEPTGALEKAAGRVTSSSDEKSATVTVSGSLFARAFRDVTITPTSARALTIPINAIAYGRRVSELEAEGWKFFKPGKQDKPLLWATDPAGASMPMYYLAAKVEQPQDRTLLPSDQEFLEAARQGARNYLEALPT